MNTVIKELQESGLRTQLKIVVVGVVITPEGARSIGASNKDAVEGVNKCKLSSK